MTVIRWAYVFIDRPRDRFEVAADFWTAVTGSTLSARWGGSGEFAALLPAAGHTTVMLQAVGDGGGAHLDLAVDDRPAAVSTATGLGAAVVATHENFAVLRSPVGTRFCLGTWNGKAERPPVFGEPGGARSRLDQIYLDIAPAAYEAEVAFWLALTGWESRYGEHPEFTLLEPPEGLPVQILLQRLDDDRPAAAHLDLACSDREATRAWHEELGASFAGRWPHWIVMTDPAGGTYCLTARQP